MSIVTLAEMWDVLRENTPCFSLNAHNGWSTLYSWGTESSSTQHRHCTLAFHSELIREDFAYIVFMNKAAIIRKSWNHMVNLTPKE